MDTMKLVEKYVDEMIATRRHFHENPEVSNAEYNTTAYIKEKLTEMNIEIAEIGLKTGVVGIIRGGKPGKTVAIREDIDALPMPELTGLPYASKVENVCHSCGHDIHTTVLLYAAKVLNDIKEELCGNVMLLFQPAEENGSGAKQMMDCKFYEVLKPDVFTGLHVAPGLPVGHIGVKKGPVCASSDVFFIKISGKGGHGAHPENCIDPIAISAYVLTQLQTVISRENHPVYPAVMTVGSIHAGSAPNIIPDYVEMSGTLRSLEPNSRKTMQAAIDRIVKCCSESMRGHGEVTWQIGMPPMICDDEVVDQVIAAAEKIIGKENVHALANPSLGSEDFSYMFPAVGQGMQFSLGTGNDDPDTRHGLHNAKTKFDEGCLPVGVGILVQHVRDYLK